MSIELLKNVLDGIEEVARHIGRYDPPKEPNYVASNLSAQADVLRQVIAEAEKQEPVAIVVASQYEDGSHAGNHLEWRGRNEANDFPEGTAIYTHPQPKRELLTDMEVRKLWANHAAKTHGWPKAGASPMHDIGNGLRFETPWHETEYQIFKAGYEAAHGIKGAA